MRIFVLFLFLIPTLTSAQLIHDISNYKVYSTLDTIETVKIDRADLEITHEDFTIRFNRNLTLNVIEKFLNDSSTLEEFIPLLERTSNFIQTNKKVIWDNPWKYGSGLPPSTDNEEHLAKKLFRPIACEMLLNGQFELIVNSKTQYEILLLSAELPEGISAPIFATLDMIGFWIWEERRGPF